MLLLLLMLLLLQLVLLLPLLLRRRLLCMLLPSLHLRLLGLPHLRPRLRLVLRQLQERHNLQQQVVRCRLQRRVEHFYPLRQLQLQQRVLLLTILPL